MRKTRELIKCPCGSEFIPNTYNQIYCTDKCGHLFNVKRYYRRNSMQIKSKLNQKYQKHERNYGEVICEWCKNKFTAWRPQQRFCCKTCQTKMWIEKGRGTRLTSNPERSRMLRLKQIFPKRYTNIERIMQQALRESDISFEPNISVAGICQPDMVINGRKIAIFCDGNYWHTIPSRIISDQRINDTLKKDGWQVLRFWETDIKKDVSRCIECIKEVMNAY